MKIAIIGTARTRSSLLIEIICGKNPDLEWLFEPYTYDSAFQVPTLETTKRLEKKDNFVAKVLAHSIASSSGISEFHFEMYDQLYFIERHDFFEQCCSLSVASQAEHWVTRNFNEHLLETFKSKNYNPIYKTTLRNIAKHIDRYLEVKRLFAKPEFVFEYNDEFLSINKPKFNILANGFDYSKMIPNYSIKSQINQVFNTYFNYQTSECDLDGFIKEIDSLDILEDGPVFSVPVPRKSMM